MLDDPALESRWHVWGADGDDAIESESQHGERIIGLADDLQGNRGQPSSPATTAVRVVQIEYEMRNYANTYRAAGERGSETTVGRMLSE